MAKGKDSASTVGKAVLISSAIAIFFCLLAIILGAALIVYTPNKESWDSCKSQANITCAGGSGAVSGGRRQLVESGFAALTSKNSEDLETWAKNTLSPAAPDRKLYGSSSNSVTRTGASNCGGSFNDEKVCEVNSKAKTVKCGNGQSTCTSSSDYTCKTPSETDNTKCFGAIVGNEKDRPSYNLGCCETSCGDGTLTRAECSASAGKFEEKCWCKFSSFSTDFGLCSSSATGTSPKMTMAKDSSGATIGTQSCYRTSSSSSNSGTSGTSGTGSTACQNPSSCVDWATNCMASSSGQFCNEAAITAVNEGYGILRAVVMIGSAVIVVGMLPICIGGTGKAMGNDDIGNICGGIGCCTSVFFTGCGGTIMIFIPFVLGSFINAACEEIRKINTEFESSCASEGVPACGTAMKADLDNLCAVGTGLMASSIVQIIAQLAGLLAVVLTMVGWCQHKKQPPVQTVVTVNAQPVGAAQPAQAQLVKTA